MKISEGFTDANGKPASVVTVLKGRDEQLKEFTKGDESVGANTVQCFVLTAPGDIISVDIKADADTADVFDLEVDGILRASATGKASVKINKVCFKAKSGGKRELGAKYCRMQVKKRDTTHGKSCSHVFCNRANLPDASFAWDENRSAVGTLVLKAWRKNPDAEATSIEATEADANTPQTPSFEQYASRQEVKGYVNKDGEEGPLPPFEIE